MPERENESVSQHIVVGMKIKGGIYELNRTG
jgi:hypothetical protein